MSRLSSRLEASEHSHAHELIDFARGITLDQLPPPVVERARMCLLEALGCGMFGVGQEWSRILAEEVIADGSRGVASLIGRSEKVSAAGAALCNGTAIHGYELDDLIASSITHPAAAVVPATLAAAEAADASGARVLEAIVAGYEVAHRLGLALGHAPSRRGFHVASLVAPPACAVAAGMVMGLSREQMFSAVGLSCSAASGMKSFAIGKGGGMVKRLHLGRGAEAGVRMSQLAKRGFLGPPFAVDSRFGLLDLFGGEDASPSRLSEGLGAEFAITRTWFKVFPVCGWIQSVVQLALALRGEGPLDPGAIRGVRVGVSSYAAQNNGEKAPIDTMGAQYSIPYCAALALLGDPRDPQMFAGEAIADPVRRALAERVEIVVDPRIEAVYPDQFGASLELVLADGSRRADTVLDCHGTPSDPCSEEESRQKFRRLSAGRLTADEMGAVLDAVAGIAADRSIRPLMQLLSRPARHES